MPSWYGHGYFWTSSVNRSSVLSVYLEYEFTCGVILFTWKVLIRFFCKQYFIYTGEVRENNDIFQISEAHLR